MKPSKKKKALVARAKKAALAKKSKMSKPDSLRDEERRVDSESGEERAASSHVQTPTPSTSTASMPSVECVSSAKKRKKLFNIMVSRVAVSVPQLWSVSPRLPHLPLAPALLWGRGQHRGMAGHSKWANIRHIKALKDGQKQKTTTKIIQMIKIAIKEGGSTDPKLNSKLSNVIDLARTQSIPLASINNIIKQAQKSQDNAKSGLVEYRGPGGVLMLVEVLTDNLIKTKGSLQSIIKKTLLQEAKGSVLHVFEEKGVVVAAAGKGAKVPSLEEALDLAIEVGAEEVEEEEEGTGRFVFTSSPDSFYGVKQGVEGRGYVVSYANVDFIPNVTINLSDEEVRKLDAIIEKLEALDEVMRVHVNL